MGENKQPQPGSRLAARSFTANHHNQRTLIAALRILSSAIVKSHTTFFPFFTNSLSPASSNEAAHFGQGCCFRGRERQGGAGGLRPSRGSKLKDTTNTNKQEGDQDGETAEPKHRTGWPKVCSTRRKEGESRGFSVVREIRPFTTDRDEYLTQR